MLFVQLMNFKRLPDCNKTYLLSQKDISIFGHTRIRYIVKVNTHDMSLKLFQLRRQRSLKLYCDEKNVYKDNNDSFDCNRQMNEMQFFFLQNIYDTDY